MGAGWNLAGPCDAFAVAAVDPSRWEMALDAVSLACGARGAVLMPTRGPAMVAASSASIAPAVDLYRQDGWAARDERYRAIIPVIYRCVGVDFDFTSLEQIKRHAYYQDFLAKVGLRWFAGVKLATDGMMWTVSIQRGIDDDPFSDEEVARLADFSTRISSAGALGRALGFARVEATLAAFEASGTAIALIDAAGRAMRLNPAAEQLLGTDIQCRDGHLSSWDAEASRALDRMLHRLVWSETETSLAPPVVLPRRLPGRRPILAHPVRIPLLTRDILGDCRAVIVFVDLDKGSHTPRELLRSAFNLTAAEARLATELGAGHDLRDAAQRRGVTYETARAQLRSVFVKTETHRQSELVALFRRLAPSDALYSR